METYPYSNIEIGSLPSSELVTCGTCGKSFPDIYPAARCPYEYEHETDTCGIPNEANWHVHVILGRTIQGGYVAPGQREAMTETTYTDVYVCDTHMRAALAGSAVGESFTMTPGVIVDSVVQVAAIRSLLKWDGHENWDILEFTVTHLR